MTTRTYHYLKSAPAGQRPARYLTLGVALAPCSVASPHTEARKLALSAWAASEWVATATDYGQAHDARGNGSAHLWRWIAARLRKGECTDLWCYGAVAVAGAIGLWERVERKGWLLCDGHWTGTAVLSDPPVIITMRPAKGKGVLRLLDLRNLGIRTIPDLREVVDGPHTVAEDWWAHGWDANECAVAIDEAIGRYVDEWHRFCDDEKLGAPKPTLAGQAWSAYRHRFITQPVLCHANGPALRLEQEAIFQGRTECYRLGYIDGPVYHLDFQSQYAAIAQMHEFPARLKLFGHGSDHNIIDLMTQGWQVIAEVDIMADKAIYPHTLKGEQVFPVGKFTTILCGYELSKAIYRYDIYKVHRFAAYEPDDIFGAWADYCIGKRLEMRRKKNRVGEYVIKMLTNGLWGRWAKRELRWRTDKEVIPDKPWGEWYEREEGEEMLRKYRSVGWLPQKFTDEGYARDASPAVYAWITSLGRSALTDAIACCPVGTVYYCATDSLLCSEAGYQALQACNYTREGIAGKMKLVATYPWIKIHGIHQWETPEGRTASGVPLKAGGRDAEGFSWENVEKPTGALRRGERPEPRIVPAARGPTLPYRHGTVGVDGKVSPLVMEEW